MQFYHPAWPHGWEGDPVLHQARAYLTGEHISNDLQEVFSGLHPSLLRVNYFQVSNKPSKSLKMNQVD